MKVEITSGGQQFIFLSEVFDMWRLNETLKRLARIPLLLFLSLSLYAQPREIDVQATYDESSGTLIVVTCGRIIDGIAMPCDEQHYTITSMQSIWLHDDYSSSPPAKWSTPSQIKGAYPFHSWSVELWETMPVWQISYTRWYKAVDKYGCPVDVWLKCRKTREGSVNHYALLDVSVVTN